MAYSAHCAGTVADWSRVRVAESDPARLRPLVAVAHGSQANYRVAEERRVPNFAECSGIARDRLALASYAANIRDRTDDHTTWEPAPERLRLVTAETPPMSFPGRWAGYSRMRLETGHKALALGGDTKGPATPTLQALWQSPMRTIFGGGAWRYRGRTAGSTQLDLAPAVAPVVHRTIGRHDELAQAFAASGRDMATPMLTEMGCGEASSATVSARTRSQSLSTAVDERPAITAANSSPPIRPTTSVERTAARSVFATSDQRVIARGVTEAVV